MHITLLTEGIHPITLGGMQKHSYNLAKYFAQQQIYVDVYYYNNDNAANIELNFSENELIYLNFIEVKYPISRKFPLHYFYDVYQYSKNIYNILKNNLHKTDFIYIQGFAGWFTLNQFKNTKNAPKTGIHFHGYEGFQPAADLRSYLQEQMVVPFLKKNISKADYIFSLGGNITKIIENKLHINPKKIIQIPIGIDIKSIDIDKKKPNNSPKKFVFVGRYSRRKGIEELTQTIKNLVIENAELSMTFIGPIPENLQIKAPNIYYTGAISDENRIFEILHNADVLICPSYAEGMPTVILEAMANKCAILATNVGAIDELVSDQTGWLIPYGNQKILQQKMIEIIGLDTVSLQQKQQAAQALVLKHYTWHTVIQQTIQELKNI
jgi:glycosyltransferase involved in cell wall biosynthesis